MKIIVSGINGAIFGMLLWAIVLALWAYSTEQEDFLIGTSGIVILGIIYGVLGGSLYGMIIGLAVGAFNRGPIFSGLTGLGLGLLVSLFICLVISEIEAEVRLIVMF